MSLSFTYTFDTPAYKGTSTIPTGLFINGEWQLPVDKKSTIDVINPSTSKHITSVYAGNAADVDLAVDAALKAYKISWGLKCPGNERGRLLNKLANLVEKHTDELAALESLNVGKGFDKAKHLDIATSISLLRYYAGWADKIHGKTIETNEQKFAYTRHEPYGVVGQIVPWNFPLLMVAAKIAPALATGNTIVIKPSEMTPLTALKLTELIKEAGFPPGVVNVVNGYGLTVGEAIAVHPKISKVAFTGSTLVGRKVMRASTESNLKPVTLELGGKSPTVVFDDADLEQAVKWAAMGVFFNAGQACIAGTRIFVQESIYDAFLEKLTGIAKALSAATGDPFEKGVEHGPLVSQTQLDRVMGYIDSGRKDGATIHIGGGRRGKVGYFVEPTIFTDVKSNMTIMREEIFGPVASLQKFKTEEEVVEAANDTVYGLACNIFSQNIGRALRVAHQLDAGSAWINSAQTVDVAVPFGGYKQSGIGREMGEYALDTYTQVKAVHVNLAMEI